MSLFSKEGKGEAYEGILIAEVRHASVVELPDDEMLASLVVTGPYTEYLIYVVKDIIHCLAQAHITKGINKLASEKC
ncbi:hypothetical protein O9992_23155 [Vibrio lentus]|nr:hypothetical protein [Vibrio lentus]